ncbi:MAG TPA: GxxExxY protein [Candidatus Sulfotelmatobacter sp.]|nr:GxxExxY protein [Candidatus Sulfotelmatobacter sp.]
MRTATSLPRIYADKRGLKYRDLTERIIGIFFNIYNELGHGFLESVYEQAFSVVLAENKIFFERQVAVPVWFHRIQISEFRADLLVEKKVLIELKTGRDIDLAWEKQLLNYLRATDIEVGLLFNFGPQAQFRRYAFENARKNPRDPHVSAEKKLPESCR